MATVFRSTETTSDLQQYHTEAKPVRDVMQHLLGNVDGQRVLEPAVGTGALLNGLTGTPMRIDCFDVSEKSLEIAKKRLPNWANYFHADFLDFFVRSETNLISKGDEGYDSVIANPPYGLKMSPHYRKQIKQKFSDVYARESYGLFLYFSLRLLKPHGRYVFIIPDTFLHSVYHRPLRRTLMQEGGITHIIQFDSSNFETVNYGYAGMCILAGNKRPQKPEDQVKWIRGRLPKPDALVSTQSSISGSKLIQMTHDGWTSNVAENGDLWQFDHTLLGSIAECRTGIYSGDNGRWCGYDSKLDRVRGAGHPIDWENEVVSAEPSPEEKAAGINQAPFYVPLVKGGHKGAFENPRWAINWSKSALTFYSNDRRARLQNSRFYFCKGLAIPMVTSGRLSASLIEGAVFDQGVVGVFPKEIKMIDFLLIYFNSKFVSEVVKASLNPSANNSANYIKRIPVPKVDLQTMELASDLIIMAKEKGWNSTNDEREILVERLTNHHLR